jgi:acetyltransferase
LVVQKQVEGLELLVSLRHDEMFGPVVTVAPGGVHIEAYSEHEVTFLAPVTASELKRRLKDTMIEQLLRGRKDLDYKSFIRLIESVSTPNEDSHLSSLEINPVIVTEDGVQCVDLLAEE